MFGPVRWQLIEFSLQHRLFDHLTEFRTSKQIANNCGWITRQTRLLLDGLCSLGILEKFDERYRMTDEAAPFLTQGSDFDMSELLLYMSSVRHSDSAKLEQLLCRGATEYPKKTFDSPVFWRNSYRRLRSFQINFGLPIETNLLTELPEWPRVKSMLDLGAGSDTLAQSLVSLRSDLKIRLFDLPESARVIEKNLGNGNAVSILAGDFNLDPLGQGYDLIWASMSLYFAKDLGSLMKKIKRALKPGGVFLSFHEALSNHRTQPEKHVTGRLIPALNGHDLSFDDGQIAHEMEQAGFHRVEYKMVCADFGDMRLDIARTE
ncbi:MAG: class I SAM-dependent methyltransferase [Pseudomonadota bacterium]